MSEKKSYPKREIARQELKSAEKLNPGKWVRHSEFAALACEKIAERCGGLDSEKAYVLGLLHDIGRREGVTSIRHVLDGYNYCEARGWTDVSRVCMTHSYPIQDIETDIGIWDMTAKEKEVINGFIQKVSYDDYDKLIQLCDCLATGTGLCLLEKRLVDTTMRYGFNDFTVDRWKAFFWIKVYFEKWMNRSVYDVVPNVKETTFIDL